MPVDVPTFIQENATRGLAWYKDGLGGDGLVSRTIREARELADGYTSKSKPKRMAAWFARHKSDLDAPRNSNANHDDFPGAGAVAWALWGGNPSSNPMRAAKWAERKAQQIDSESERSMADDSEIPTRQVTLLWGPPCAGKSTLVRELSKRGDIILDRDQIHSALSGLAPHDHDDNVSPIARAVWNEALRQLQGPNTARAFVLAGVPTMSQRSELASVITDSQLIYADRETCHARAQEAQRPEKWHEYIDRWHDNYEPDSESDRSLKETLMNYERRTANEPVHLEEGEGLTAVGYAAVFNSTSQNLGGFVERIAPTAFRKTLQEADVRALFNHDPDALLGRTSNGTLRLMEDDHGLRYEVDLPNTNMGRDVAELLSRGDLNGSSFGFRMISDTWSTTDDDFPLRTITELSIRDVGPVSFPAYESSEASLRSLVTDTLPIEDVMEAAKTNSLQDVITKEDVASEEGAEEEPHSDGPAPSAFIR